MVLYIIKNVFADSNVTSVNIIEFSCGYAAVNYNFKAISIILGEDGIEFLIIISRHLRV